MRNADMPANSNSLEISERYEEGYYDQVALGLTKREAFAMAAMQGMLSNSSILDNTDEDAVSYVTEGAVKMADALLKELDNEN